MNPREQVRKPSEFALQRALWSGLILVLIGVIGAGTWSLSRLRMAATWRIMGDTHRLPIYGSVPDFLLVERSGRKFERLDFLGKIWIVNFIYTRCPDSCPLQTAEMARLQADFASELDVRLVSITIDPGHDTPRVLSRYADRFRANHERWLFLTGERKAIYRFAQEGLRLPILDPRNEAGARGSDRGRSESFHLPQIHPSGHHVSDLGTGAAVLPGALWTAFEAVPAMAGEGAGPGIVLHSSRFVLIDRKARIRNYYDSTDMESLQRLRQDVKALLQEE